MSRPKLKICPSCSSPNYEDAKSCESCHKPFAPSKPEYDKKLTGDMDFKYICPFKFHDIREKMIPKNMSGSVKLPDIDELQNFLVYEVFEVSDISFVDFLEEIGLGKIGLAPVKDQKYVKAWTNIKGNGAERFLLYPANDKFNRLYDAATKDDDFPEQLKNFDKSKYGEISVILKQIENSDDYCCEEVGVKGYSKDKTYCYNVINQDYDELIFTIRPCCPRCRTLLPDNWFSKAVNAYVPIALIASKASGKTTYMTSLLDPIFTGLLKGLGVTKWQVVSAIEYEEERFAIQSTRYENYRRLKEEGRYPIPTQSVMPPVCLNIQKLENGNAIISQIIVGIFDCPGEFFDPKSKRMKDNALKFLNSMQSFICLVEPKQMEGIPYVFLSDEKFEPKLIRPFEQQGAMQEEYKGYTLKANDIIKKMKKDSQTVDIFEMMAIINTRLTKQNVNLHHIAYTIVKSDELEEYKDDWEDVDGMEELLLPRMEENVINRTSFAFIDKVVRNFFEKVVFKPKDAKRYMEFLENIGGKRVSKSWHCVSVARKLPSNERINDRECEFFPVRITEPFVRCLIDKMKELGLIEW